MSHTSDPTGGPSPAVRNQTGDAPRGSGSHSRGGSPLRQILQQWGSLRGRGGHNWREELFIPEDPFRAQTKFSHLRTWIPCLPAVSPETDVEEGKEGSSSQSGARCDEIIFPKTSRQAAREFLSSSSVFLRDATRVVYLWLLLRLPALYFGRVSRYVLLSEACHLTSYLRRIFIEAEVCFARAWWTAV